jgi:hypothetical protein
MLVKGLNDVLTKVGDFLNSTRGKADVQQFWHIVATAIISVGKAIGDILPTAVAIARAIFGVASAFEHLLGSGLTAKIGLVAFALLKIPAAGKIASAGLGLLFANPLLGGLAITAGALYLLSRQASGIGAAADTAASKLAHLYDVKNHSAGTALDIASAQLNLQGALGASGSTAQSAAKANARVADLKAQGAPLAEINKAERLAAAATRIHERAAIDAGYAQRSYNEAVKAGKQGLNDRTEATKALGKSLDDLVTQSKSAFAIPTGRSPNGPVTPPDRSSQTIGAAADAFNTAAQKSSELSAAGKQTAAQLAGVIRQAKTINDARIIAHIGARDIGAGKTIEDVRRAAMRLHLLRPKPLISADTSMLVAAVNRGNALLAQLVRPRKVTVSPVGFDAVNTAIDGVNRNILHLTQNPFTVRVNYATGAPPKGGHFNAKGQFVYGARGGMAISGQYGQDNTLVRVTGQEAILNPTQQAMVDSGLYTVMGALAATGAPTIQAGGAYKGGAKPRRASSLLTEGGTGHADPSTTAAGIQNLNGTIGTLIKKLASEQADVFKKQSRVRELGNEKRNLAQHTPPVAPKGGRKHDPQGYAAYERERANYRQFQTHRKAEELKLSNEQAKLHQQIADENRQMRKDRHQLATAKADLRKLQKTTSKAPNFPAFDSQLTTLLDALGEQTSVLGPDGNLASGSPQTLRQIVSLLQGRVTTLKGFLANPKYKPFITAIQDELRIDEQNLGQYRKQGHDASLAPAFDLQGLLDAGGFTRAIAGAGLTDDTSDDVAALGSEKSFLESLLSNPAISGSNADYVTVANAIAGVNSQLASFASAGPTADQSAQIQQLQQQLAIQTRATGLSDAALQVFGGSGDIGSGGYANAVRSAQGSGPTIVQNNYMLHPGDPAVLRTIAEASNSGNSMQPSIPSSRTTVNL